jgi:hypothetical protein
MIQSSAIPFGNSEQELSEGYAVRHFLKPARASQEVKIDPQLCIGQRRKDLVKKAIWDWSERFCIEPARLRRAWEVDLYPMYFMIIFWGISVGSRDRLHISSKLG